MDHQLLLATLHADRRDRARPRQLLRLGLGLLLAILLRAWAQR